MLKAVDQLGCKALELVMARVGGVKHDGLTDGLAKQVVAQLADPMSRQQLLVLEIDEQGEESGAVLRRRLDGLGERGPNDCAAVRTPFDLRPVFGDFECGLGQLEDLAALIVDHGVILQERLGTAGTGGDRQYDGLVRIGQPFQGGARMSRLATGFSTGCLAQAFWFGFSQAIGSRGLIAVLAVLIEAGFQLRHAPAQVVDLLLQRQDQIDQSLRIGFDQDQQVFASEHGGAPVELARGSRNWGSRG